MTVIEFPRVVWEFLAATNCGNREWLETLFDDDCTLFACGFRAVGREAIRAWSETEVIGAEIVLSLLEVHMESDVTTLHVQAVDHGLINECDLAFHTRGRYITSLTIRASRARVTFRSRLTEARLVDQVTH